MARPSETARCASESESSGRSARARRAAVISVHTRPLATPSMYPITSSGARRTAAMASVWQTSPSNLLPFRAESSMAFAGSRRAQAHTHSRSWYSFMPSA